MKKTTIMRIASTLLIAVLLTTCAIGATFAKYTTTASGSDKATVAKWEIEVNDAEITVETPSIAFNLFDTINSTNGAAEEKVATGLIAPGTQGQFALKVENLSEVDAKYTITLAEENTANVPLQYSVDGENWVDSIDELTMTALTNVAINMNASDTQTVYWRWVFNDVTTAVTDGSAHANQTNTTDTTLGIAAQETTEEITITATITVEQVDE